MKAKASLLDQVQIASPCATNWESMAGNDQVRFCSHCARDVFNLSAMTRQQGEALVAQANGRLCVRYVREVNGAMVTTEAPRDFAMEVVAPRILAGAISAALIVNSSTLAQSGQNPPKTQIEVSRLVAESAPTGSAISGVVLDPNGSRIAQAKLSLSSEVENRGYKLVADDEGQFRFAALPAGKYALAIEATGFAPFAMRHLSISEGEEAKVTAALQVGVQICETVEIKGIGFVTQAEVGTLMIRKRSFWQWLVYITTYPYRQGKRILKH